MNEDQAEHIKIASTLLATAETRLVTAQKEYRRALRQYDDACQLRLSEEKS